MSLSGVPRVLSWSAPGSDAKHPGADTIADESCTGRYVDWSCIMIVIMMRVGMGLGLEGAWGAWGGPPLQQDQFQYGIAQQYELTSRAPPSLVRTKVGIPNDDGPATQLGGFGEAPPRCRNVRKGSEADSRRADFLPKSKLRWMPSLSCESFIPRPTDRPTRTTAGPATATQKTHVCSPHTVHTKYGCSTIGLYWGT